ncbi:MalY/PatB family protein [Vineibacter terrae]|uniref:MalY/PatB family protein n=1 Tax=Vineibacter terrae TaxID=2586908 RepID=UPI001C49C468|nr:aminotransferase class I/II-fold pyridoxal phosphate-dependent enzyme [Vineibacter terrae]
MPANDFDLPEAALRALRNSKWSKYGPDVLPAWVAEMDFAVAEPIQQAVQRIVEARDYGYPMRNGDKAGAAVTVSFAARMKERFGWEVDPALVLPLADLVQGTYAPVLAFSEPGDGVVLQVPNYPPFRDVIQTTGRKLIPLAMRDDGSRHVCDTAELAGVVDGRTRIFVLCNPQNPTGRVFTRAELQAMARFAIDHDMIVISDEIHADLVYPGHQHIPLASLGPEIAARTVTITSPTKSFNIPGLRCAVLHFGSARLRDRFLARIPARLMGDPNAIGVDATVAAWSAGQPWLDAVTAHLLRARDRLVGRLQAELPEIRCHAPEGTFLAWLDCTKLGFNTSAFDFFHDKARIAFSAGETFDPACHQFVRFNFATSMPILDKLLDRMVTAVRRS